MKDMSDEFLIIPSRSESIHFFNTIYEDIVICAPEIVKGVYIGSSICSFPIKEKNP